MSGKVCLEKLDIFLGNTKSNGFNLDMFNNVFNETIKHLSSFPEDEENRIILINSLISSMLVYDSSIPKNQHADLLKKLKATFNQDEQADQDLHDLFLCLTQVSQH